MGPSDLLKQHLSVQCEPSDSRYRCFNTGGVEMEVGEFLYGLVRMLKPDAILETGTHRGISAAYMALALQRNGSGRLTTVEMLEENIEAAHWLFARLGLLEYIVQVRADTRSYAWSGPGSIGLVFLDREPWLRFGELLAHFPSVEAGGMILVHDLHHHLGQEDNAEHGFAWPWGPLPEGLQYLLASGQLRPIHFRTPRGWRSSTSRRPRTMVGGGRLAVRREIHHRGGLWRGPGVALRAGIGARRA